MWLSVDHVDARLETGRCLWGRSGAADRWCPRSSRVARVSVGRRRPRMQLGLDRGERGTRGSGEDRTHACAVVDLPSIVVDAHMTLLASTALPAFGRAQGTPNSTAAARRDTLDAHRRWNSSRPACRGCPPLPRPPTPAFRAHPYAVFLLTPTARAAAGTLPPSRSNASKNAARNSPESTIPATP